MDRCALFVDAGYVLADGAMAVHGTRRRESVSWDYAGLLQLLASLAADRSGLPLLRCYWYEATVEGRRGADHDALADLPGVKLRLAKMRPGRREGVESEIHRDLATLARNKAVSDAMIISAEEDLAGIIADVQDLGMRVTMLHITVDGDWTISRALRQECDDIVEINAAHLRPYVELISGAEPSPADEHDSPVGSAIALRRPAANGHGSGPAGNGSVPAEGIPAGNGGVLANGVPANGGQVNGAPVVRIPSFTPAIAGGHDNGYHDNGYHLAPSGYAEYPEPVVADFQRGTPPPGPGRPVAANGPGPAQFVGPSTDELPVEEEPTATSMPAIPAAAGPAAPYSPAVRGDDAPTLYPMPAQAAMPAPPPAPAGPVGGGAPGAPGDPGRADARPRPEVYPAPVSAEAAVSQFVGEWADTRPAVPAYLDELIAPKPAGRPYPAPDIPAYSPGASREPASGDTPPGEIPGMTAGGRPEQVPVPVSSAGPGAQIRHLPNGYSAGQPSAYGQPPVYGGRSSAPGVPGGPGQQPVLGPPAPGPGPQQVSGPQPVAPPASPAPQSMASQSMAPQSMAQPGMASQPMAPQPVAGPHPGQHLPIGAGPAPAGGPVSSGPVPPGGPVPPSGPVPLNGLPGGNGPVPGPGNGMAAANGMVPLNGLAQTSGLMAVAGNPPPPGTGLTPVQGPAGGPPGAPGPGGPGAPGGPGGPASFGGGQPQAAMSLADAVQAAHEEGQEFGGSVARDAPALWLEAVLARKPRMPSDLEARLLQGSSLPIDFLLHDEVRHALRRGFWDALERARR